jgi:hypothetical protein
MTKEFILDPKTIYLNCYRDCYIAFDLVRRIFQRRANLPPVITPNVFKFFTNYCNLPKNKVRPYATVRTYPNCPLNVGSQKRSSAVR